jgi:cell division protein FtsQ
MARTDSAVLPHEETAPAQEEFLHPEMDGRFTNLDEEDSTPFLRKQRRVPVRRGPLPKKTTKLLQWIALGICALTALGIAYAFIYRYGERSWRFRVDSSDQIEIAGTQNVTRPQIMDVLGSDIGRNIFFVPLDERREQLEQIPWVESAAVMRFVPNRLRVVVQERTPVAFVRIGSHIGLIDNTGHIMEIPAHNKTQYSFPVIAGTRDTEPLSTRAARMKVYNELVRELDSEGGHYSSELSEVDLTDPEDTKVLVSDPSGDVLLHLGSVGSGSGNYLDRFKLYHAHVAEWRQQFEKLDSVDLRYERQIVVNPDLRSPDRAAALSPAAAKAAVKAGVPAVAIAAAALVLRQQTIANPPIAKPPLTEAKTTAKLPLKAAETKAQAGKSVAPKPATSNAAAPKLVARKVAAPKPVTPNATQKVKPVAKAHAAGAHTARPHAAKVHPAGVHPIKKRANKKAAHKRGRASKHATRRSQASPSAALNVKSASAKTTATALVPARPHQVAGPTRNSNGGKPHAAIVKQ